MSMFSYAFQPELISLGQKDEELINRIFQSLVSVLEKLMPSVISQRVLQKQMGRLKFLAQLLYYCVCYKLTVGEEYVNVRGFNQDDYDYKFTDLSHFRRVSFVALKFVPFLTAKLRQRLLMYQGSAQWIKSLPDLELIVEGIKELHFAYFLIHGRFYEISKALVGMDEIFTRDPLPAHNISYMRLGRIYFVLLLITYGRNIYKYYQSVQIAKSRSQLLLNQDKSGMVAGSGQATQCLLCYDDCKNISCSPCGHLFCWDCIMKSIHMKAVCPVCRAECPAQKVVQLMNYS